MVCARTAHAVMFNSTVKYTVLPSRQYTMKKAGKHQEVKNKGNVSSLSSIKKEEQLNQL